MKPSRSNLYLQLVWLAVVCVPENWAAAWQAAPGEKWTIDRFEVQALTEEYYSEGAAIGDLDGDGNADAIYGPHWYAGPDFREKFEIYPPKPQNREGYADHFFVWAHDIDRDGFRDLLVAGFPGTAAYVYKNPGKQVRTAGPWSKHQVLDWVSNEAPQWLQVVGDATPELICTRDGFFGYATVDRDKPLEAWTFHPVSAQVADKRFGHGLGAGDVNGDGLIDLIHAGGWLEQPPTLDDAKPWRQHDAKFSTAYGGAEMFAYDVDGDGDNDIITSLAAHDYGLAWYEQREEGGERTFQRHDIVGKKPEDNRYGVVFTELHSVQLADIDGDGLKDIVTGKTYYSHHKGSPMWDAGAVVYWFRLVRGPEGIDWVPYLAAEETGIGRQIALGDLQGDGLIDIAVGGMKGMHLLHHRRQEVDRDAWGAFQPVAYVAPEQPESKVGGRLEGESMKLLQVTGGDAKEQPMGGFSADHWSNDSQLWWTGAKPGDRLELELPVTESGSYEVRTALTKARDYAIVQVLLDGKKLGEPIDLYHAPEVISTGNIRLGEVELAEGNHLLAFEIVGKHPDAVPGYMLGIDMVQLGKGAGQLPRDATGKSLNFDFEKGTLEDWVVDGKAFEGQPVQGDAVAARRPDMRSEHQGKYWVGSYEIDGDAPQGTLRSVPFEVTHPYASFLIGGGAGMETRMELIDASNGKAIYRAMGRTTENMRLVVADLREHEGKRVAIQLTDASGNGWGHLNFDDFRFHTDPPGPVTPAESPLVPDEYPHQGLDAAAAVAAMTLPDGFRAVVGATEPEVKQPIAMALDDRGRVWVAEAYEYPNRAPGDQGRDRILIFEDTDGDGSLDQRKVFTEGLNLISGMEVGFGGVWVGAAPYLLFIPDADRDDQPDGPPQILLDGWGLEDTHETLNAFLWGPDGWLYGCHGVFTHSKVGKPGTPADQRTAINAGVWRYHPTQHRFEVFAHGTSNPWGVDFNDHGQAFITACVIPHLFHMIQGGRYERQAGNHFNPYTYDDIKTIADHRHYVGGNPHGGNGKSDSAGGGHAHAGAMIYLGDRWPQEYRNRLFMNNIHGQRLNVDLLKPNGSGYIGSHAPDFLLTGDQASQMLYFRYGPDGNVWIIDWYDMQACHTGDAKKHDRSNGRIYKIVYGESTGQKGIDLAGISDLELAKLAGEENDWYVRHARRLLQERAVAGKIDPGAIAWLEEFSTQAPEDRKRLRAIWALHAIGADSPRWLDRWLTDSSPYVRGWAIQLALEGKAPVEGWTAAKLASLAENDPSPIVQLYLASAAQRLTPADRWPLVEALADRISANDHNLPLMLWYAAEPLVDDDPARAMALAVRTGTKLPKLREYLLRRLGSQGDQAIDLLVRGLGTASDNQQQAAFLQALSTALQGLRRVDPPASWKEVAGKVLKSPDPAIQLQAQAIGVTFGDETALAAVRSVAMNKEATVESRVAALQALLAARDPKLAAGLQKLIEEPAMRPAALAGLAQYADPQTPAILLKAYEGYSQSDRRLALSALAARKDSAVALLDAVAKKQIPATDLGADLVRQLQFLKDPTVQQLLEKTWGTVRETPEEKQQMIVQYKQLVEEKKGPKPDPMLGRTIYSKTCQQCHVLFAKGGNVGPELTGSNRANLDYLLSNIVDPSAVMAKEYQPTIVLTEDGRVVTGIVRSETDQALTLQTADATEVIPKEEIEQRMLSEKSMMPEDQLRPFSPHEIRSLVAYLGSSSQVPMLATVENAATLFNGKDLSGWEGDSKLWKVDQGEIVGTSEGLEHNDFLVSDLAVGDFRLSMEVLLEKNEGNSGVQLRSTRTAEGMKGYQADIGKGWWGKLYEEEGRGLLWEQSGELHVREGDWNQYVIEAKGHRIRSWINGQPCVDLEDPKGALRGVFGLQLHSGGPTVVRFRNLKLEVLAP